MESAEKITKNLKHDRTKKIEQVQSLLKEIDLIDEIIIKMSKEPEREEVEFDEDPE